MATAWHVHSQGSEGNEWHLVEVPSSVVTLEVTWVMGGACSWTPNGGGPCPPLESKMDVAVFPPPLLLAHAKVPCSRRAQIRSTLPPTACGRDAPLPESSYIHREKYSYGGSAPPPPALPNNGTLLLLWAQASCCIPWLWSSTPQTVAHSLTGCLQINNPSCLPRTNL